MSELKEWKLVSSNLYGSFRIFDLKIEHFISPKTNKEYEFYIIESNSWVNVIPLTEDKNVVFIKQFRHGIRGITLEIPGGIVEEGDDPKSAAIRELQEETGYSSQNIEFLGKVHPNPAFLTNWCYTYLATDVKKIGEQKLEEREDIEVVLIPLDKVIDLILHGKITHSLVISAFAFFFGKKSKIFG